MPGAQPHLSFVARLVEPGAILSAQEPVATQPIPVFKMMLSAAHLSQFITVELLEPKALYNLSSTRMRISEW